MNLILIKEKTDFYHLYVIDYDLNDFILSHPNSNVLNVWNNIPENFNLVQLELQGILGGIGFWEGEDEEKMIWTSFLCNLPIQDIIESITKTFNTLKFKG